MSAAEWLDGLIAIPDRYPRPKWQEIAARVEKATPSERDEAWRAIAERWMQVHCATGGGRYALARSENFLLASALEKRPAANLLAFAERARRGIRKALNGLVSTEAAGRPHVILVFETDEEYYDYTAPFYPDGGHYAVSAGVHLDAGYGHIALPRRQPDLLETVVAHELAHEHVSHLPLPRWLDEGIAVNLESLLCARYARRLELAWADRHRRWWDPHSVQDYWSGHAFDRPDRYSELSYELAWVTVRSLAEDYEAFRDFALHASFEDGGQRAALKQFGHGLGVHFEAILGEGDWEPDPSAWITEEAVALGSHRDEAG